MVFSFFKVKKGVAIFKLSILRNMFKQVELFRDRPSNLDRFLAAGSGARVNQVVDCVLPEECSCSKKSLLTAELSRDSGTFDGGGTAGLSGTAAAPSAEAGSDPAEAVASTPRDAFIFFLGFFFFVG